MAYYGESFIQDVIVPSTTSQSNDLHDFDTWIVDFDIREHTAVNHGAREKLANGLEPLKINVWMPDPDGGSEDVGLKLLIQHVRFISKTKATDCSKLSKHCLETSGWSVDVPADEANGILKIKNEAGLVIAQAKKSDVGLPSGERFWVLKCVARPEIVKVDESGRIEKC